MSTPETLAQNWRDARLPAAGVHLDSAACSRQSLAVIEAAAAHARHESEVGGYVAAEAAASLLDAGRAGIAALTGLSPEDVVFTTGSGNALELLLGAWPMERTVACLPGEYGPNLAAFFARGFARRALPVDDLGRVDPDAARTVLADNPPAMVHLTAVGSHRGVVQPVSAIAEVCRDVGVPLVVDAAQALAQIDCVADADAVYSSSRKWLAGPRGVGVLAVRPALADLLQSPEWAGSLSALQCLEIGEANIAARVGFSVAVGQHLAAGPELVRQRLAALGSLTRTMLADVAGWRVVEPEDEPTAITTLAPTDGADPVQVRARLISEHGIVTTAAGVERAPLEMTTPVLRVSPHVDAYTDDLERFVTALRAVT
ncbi:ergothioneine biosynthesis PLP-dependent enzyme EgtE [Mycobacterium sp. CVI_P3]|uniref:Probable hercynylcysteine sulfoxide lyase n=1 Tax=Mycobacterium pinniadriaticum TaxID=2994102 RepID=A0ABT3SJ43_9MYCO|nr:ergothioneine biosynthesis PLP-dependent enzyme EgtE [Mycobacterium pinniadriaticum]MCX2933158.1 ergothioneine biosynthesis PLP-dependent enzyme EgtE [Mycobacterium pinniadriaticum]MCX2939542.1 ergothioneine biosynthesis PLP-dependent enzyme EgtE [Mycobacterium pinniadriaticum]